MVKPFVFIRTGNERKIVTNKEKRKKGNSPSNIKIPQIKLKGNNNLNLVPNKVLYTCKKLSHSRRFRHNLIDDIMYYGVEGGEDVNYKALLQLVAAEHNTTPEEVEAEMQAAINATGLDISPQLFIALCAAKIKKDYIQ